MPRTRGLLIGYGVIAVFSLWPLGVAMGAGLFASLNGCALDEGSAHPCVVWGKDIGGTLYDMGVMGWFALATVPAGAIAFLLWTVGWSIWAARKRKAV